MAARKKKTAKTSAKKKSKRKTVRKRKTSTRAKSSPPPADEGFLILFDDEPAHPPREESANAEAGIVRLRRDCTLEEIAGIRQRLLTALDKEGSLVVDLGAVKDVDSAFLQLLCSLKLEADARKLQVSFRNQTDFFLQSAATLGLARQLAEG